MDSAENSLSVFEKACAYCGARFRVLAPLTDDHHHSEDVACPECGKTYAMEASSKPVVQ